MQKKIRICIGLFLIMSPSVVGAVPTSNWGPIGCSSPWPQSASSGLSYESTYMGTNNTCNVTVMSGGASITLTGMVVCQTCSENPACNSGGVCRCPVYINADARGGDPNCDASVHNYQVFPENCHYCAVSSFTDDCPTGYEWDGSPWVIYESNGLLANLQPYTDYAQCVKKISCAAGQYKNGGNCTDCPVGTYQENSNFTGTSCTQCPGIPSDWTISTSVTSAVVVSLGGSDSITDCYPNPAYTFSDTAGTFHARGDASDGYCHYQFPVADF